MTDYSLVHETNIFIHVIAGSIALLLGFIALLTTKGGKWYKKSGNHYLILSTIVVLTGLIGVFVFKRNTFLLIITVLSGYYAFSGYRTLQTKSNIPKPIEICIGLISVISVLYFLYYFRSIGMYWPPVIV